MEGIDRRMHRGQIPLNPGVPTASVPRYRQKTAGWERGRVGTLAYILLAAVVFLPMLFGQVSASLKGVDIQIEQVCYANELLRYYPSSSLRVSKRTYDTDGAAASAFDEVLTGATTSTRSIRFGAPFEQRNLAQFVDVDDHAARIMIVEDWAMPDIRAHVLVVREAASLWIWTYIGVAERPENALRRWYFTADYEWTTMVRAHYEQAADQRPDFPDRRDVPYGLGRLAQC